MISNSALVAVAPPGTSITEPALTYQPSCLSRPSPTCPNIRPLDSTIFSEVGSSPIVTVPFKLPPAKADDSRMYVCVLDNCGKTYKRLEHLNRHHLTHNNHRRYRCLVCGSGYNRQDKLRQHVRKLNFPRNIRPRTEDVFKRRRERNTSRVENSV